MQKCGKWSKHGKCVVSIKLFSYTTFVYLIVSIYHVFMLFAFIFSYSCYVLLFLSANRCWFVMLLIKELEWDMRGTALDLLGPLIVLPCVFFPNTSWTSGWLKVSQVNDFNAAILFPQNTTTWYVFINYQLNLDIMFLHHVFVGDLQTFRPKRGPVFAGKWLGENSSLLGDPLELEVYGIARK